MLHLQFGHLANVKIKEAEREFYAKREHDGLRGDQLIFGTYDLLEYLNAENPGCMFHFVMGGDTVVDLVGGKWRRTDEMLKNVPIVAIKRKGVALDTVDLSKFQAGIQVFEIPDLSQVSSTEVRRRIQAGESVENLVDDRVRQFILDHHLYGKL